jgi:hypothetical protein
MLVVAVLILLFVLKKNLKILLFQFINLRNIEAKYVDVVGLSDGASSTSEPKIKY